jgi:hypothetical protein
MYIYFSSIIHDVNKFFLIFQERIQLATNRRHGTIPDESSFVVAARDAIPAARIRESTGTIRGRGRASKTARGRAPGQGQGRGRAPGQGQGRGRTAGQGRGRATTKKRARNEGHVDQQQGKPIPDLNGTADGDGGQVTQDGGQVTQDGGHAPLCCVLECTSYTDKCMFV